MLKSLLQAGNLLRNHSKGHFAILQRQFSKKEFTTEEMMSLKGRNHSRFVTKLKDKRFSDRVRLSVQGGKGGIGLIKTTEKRVKAKSFSNKSKRLWGSGSGVLFMWSKWTSTSRSSIPELIHSSENRRQWRKGRKRLHYGIGCQNPRSLLHKVQALSLFKNRYTFIIGVTSNICFKFGEPI